MLGLHDSLLRESELETLATFPCLKHLQVDTLQLIGSSLTSSETLTLHHLVSLQVNTLHLNPWHLSDIAPNLTHLGPLTKTLDPRGFGASVYLPTLLRHPKLASLGLCLTAVKCPHNCNQGCSMYAIDCVATTGSSSKGSSSSSSSRRGGSKGSKRGSVTTCPSCHCSCCIAAASWLQGTSWSSCLRKMFGCVDGYPTRHGLPALLPLLHSLPKLQLVELAVPAHAPPFSRGGSTTYSSGSSASSVDDAAAVVVPPRAAAGGGGGAGVEGAAAAAGAMAVPALAGAEPGASAISHYHHQHQQQQQHQGLIMRGPATASAAAAAAALASSAAAARGSSSSSRRWLGATASAAATADSSSGGSLGSLGQWLAPMLGLGSPQRRFSCSGACYEADWVVQQLQRRLPGVEVIAETFPKMK